MPTCCCCLLDDDDDDGLVEGRGRRRKGLWVGMGRVDG